MMFAEKYTTEALKAADTMSKEAKKAVVSNDTYAICELKEKMIQNLDALRLAVIKHG